MRRATSLIAILVFTPLASLVAQGFPPLRGDRVRIDASQTADGRYGRFAGSVVRRATGHGLTRYGTWLTTSYLPRNLREASSFRGLLGLSCRRSSAAQLILA